MCGCTGGPQRSSRGAAPALGGFGRWLTCRNPYVGPRPFERDDRAMFFAREAETRELLSLVVSERVVLLYAASGAGKTSLLHAGLAPLAERRRASRSSRWRVSEDGSAKKRSVSSNVYMLGVLSTLNARSGEPAMRRRLDWPDARRVPRATARTLSTSGTGRSARPDLRPVRGTLHALSPLLAAARAVREADSPRARGRPAPARDPRDPRGLRRAARSVRAAPPAELRTRFRLERLGPDEAIAAVVKPVATTSYAPGVAEKLVADLLRFRVDTGRGRSVEIEGEYVEPVQLQVACQSLWSELPADVDEITEEHLRTFGDVDEVLRRFYDEAVRAAAARHVSGGARPQAGRRFVHHLGRHAQHGLPPYRRDGRLANAAIEELENRRVIRAEWRAGTRWYELTHDRLIEPIQSSNARAEQARRRRQRILISSGALVLLLAAAALIFTSVDQQQPELAQRVAVSSARTTYNVTYSKYLRLAGGSLGGVSPEALAVRGNLVSVNIATSGYRGEALVITPSTRDARTRRSIAINSPAPTSPAGFAPKADVESSVRPVWIPLPERTGRFSYMIRVTGAGVPLAIAGTRRLRRQREARRGPELRGKGGPVGATAVHRHRDGDWVGARSRHELSLLA